MVEWIRMAALAAVAVWMGCGSSHEEGDAPPGPDAEVARDAAAGDLGPVRTCAEWQADVSETYAAIRACESADECGEPIGGLSCGCTRAPVARLDADVPAFQALLGAAPPGCSYPPGIPLGSTCDCPAADGFVCMDGVCGWNYL